MIQDYFINATILITYITLGNLFFLRERDLKNSNFIFKTKLGIASGLLGCILMIFSIELIPSVIIDFRHTAIIIGSIFGGIPGSIISSLIIGLFRILYFGITKASIAAFTSLVIMGLGCAYVSAKASSLIRKWSYGSILCMFTTTIVLTYLIGSNSILKEALIFYIIGSILIGIILFFITHELIATNEIYRKYKEESSKDYLTGLNNVRQFDKVFNTICEKVVQRKEHLSLLFIDIDYFKNVNDTYGHAEGDIVLKDLGNILLDSSRDFDIVSRNGGEEFSVMLLDCLPEQAVCIAERIRKAVENYPFVLSDGKVINITTSIGIACYPDTVNDIKNLKEEADNALYKAKQTGRNKVVMHEG
jgi:diguanylate cyclase